MEKKKILITGSCGFIGSNLVRTIRSNIKDYDIVSIDKITLPIFQKNIYINKNHKFYLGSIEDSHFINRVFDIEKPDYVMHLAAESHVDASISNPNAFVNSNVLGTQVLVNASVKYDIQKFIYISTDEVYGALSHSDAPWTEDSQINPKNPYSASKAAGELVVQAAMNTHKLPVVITRSCNNFGPRQAPDKLIPKVIKCILNNEKIPVYGQGLQTREWIYVIDNCWGLIAALQNGVPGEVYNISTSAELSNIELVQKICNLLEDENKNAHDLISFVEDRKGHDFRYSINSDKLKSLGWSPKFKFTESLATTVSWFKSNKNWWFKNGE